MSPALERHILTRWPNWFYFGEVPFRFQHGDGWYALLVQTLTAIDSKLPSGAEQVFKVLDVRERGGELIVTSTGAPPEIYVELMELRHQSRQFCELCGAPATARPVLPSTRCDHCWSAIKEP